jgi:hypothetical protein
MSPANLLRNLHHDSVVLKLAPRFGRVGLRCVAVVLGAGRAIHHRNYRGGFYVYT